MGKLLDMLERASRGTVQPLGFGALRKEKVPPLLMLGCVPVGDSASASRVAEAGLHALAWTVGDGAKKGLSSASAKAAEKGLNGLAWGVWQRDIDASPVKGADFEVFSSEESPIGPLEDEGRTILMQIAPEMEDGLLRTMEELPVDGFVVSLADASSLTVRQLVRIARVRGVSSRYLLVHLSLLPSKEELAVLRDAGISAVLVDAADHSIEALKSCRARLEELPQATPPRRSERSVATLPPIRAAARPPQREEEEDDEEEDD